MFKGNGLKMRLLSMMLVFVLTMANVAPMGAVYAQDVQETAQTSADTQQTDTDATENGTQVQTGESEADNQDGSGSGIVEDVESTDETADATDKTESTTKTGDVASTSALMAVAEETQKQQTATGLGATVTIEMFGYKEAATTTTVTMPTEYYSLQDYGFSDAITDPGFYTMLHALAEYEVQKYQKDGITRSDAALLIDCPTGFVKDIEEYIAGLEASSYLGWVFWKNGSAIQEGVSTVAVSDGDCISVVPGWWYYSSGLYLSTSYCKFTSIPTDAIAQKTFEVEVSAIDTGNQSNPSGITVSVLDGEKNVVAEGITDASGIARIRVPKEGSYTLTAIRHPDIYETRPGVIDPVDITIPYGSLEVAAGEQITDEEAVQNIADSLNIDSVLTENISLIKDCDYGVTVSWVTDDDKVVTTEGIVKRAVLEDKQTILRATISKGEAEVEKTFPVTVKGLELIQSLDVVEGVSSTVGQNYIQSYLYYIDEDAEKVTLKVTPSEKTTMLWAKQGSKSLGMFFDASEQSIPIDVKTLKPGEDTEISLDVRLGALGNGTIKVQIKKYNSAEPTLPQLPSSWATHMGGLDNNAVTTAPTPTESTELAWESFAEGEASWGTWNAGSPILVNGKLYVARNNQLQILNASTGVVEKSVALDGKINTYSVYITYGAGKVFVPLADGRIQAFHASTLESLFVTQTPADGMFTNSTMYIKDGLLYVGYTNYSKGFFAAYEITDLDADNTLEVIAPKWTYDSGSYYGMGAVAVKDYVVFAGDAGNDSTIVVADADTGEVKSKTKLSGKAHSAIVEADGSLYLTTQAPKLYKLAVDIAGSLIVQNEVALPSTTNASPVIVGGKVYVTGGSWGGGYLQVFDTSLNLLAETSLENPGNTPTVKVSNGTAYVYFTQNGPSGSLHMATVTADNQISVKELFVPSHPQYSMSNVIVGEDGTLYYGNDAGYLYAIKAAQPSIPVTPVTPTTPTTPAAKPTTDSAKPTAIATTTLLTAKNSEEADGSEDDLVKAIQSAANEEKSSVTVKNVPETIEAEVFAELAKHKSMRLILDFGTYTISIKGEDVRNPKATFRARLIEEDSTLTEQEETLFAKYQQLKFEQDGELPGKMTVVYQLPEQLKDMQAAELFAIENLTSGNEVTLQNEFAMFTLEKCGSYILAETAEMEAEALAISEEGKQVRAIGMDDSEESNGLNGVWIAVIAVTAGVAVVGTIAGTVVYNRKKKRTWESEK